MLRCKPLPLFFAAWFAIWLALPTFAQAQKEGRDAVRDVEPRGVERGDEGEGRDSRLPVPTAPQAKQALAQIKDIFRDDYVGATTPQSRLALAKQLLGHADKTAAPIERWALCSEAMRLAADAGDTNICLEAIDIASRHFIIEDELRIDAITKLSTKAKPQDLDELARMALGLAKKAVTSGEPGRSQRCLSLASGLARKSKNITVIAEIARLQQSLRDEEKSAKERAAMDARLAAGPDDPDVCEEVGSFYCFKAEIWEKGLPLLTKGSDADLARLANAELKAGNRLGDVVGLADAWWAWADKQSGNQKAAGRMHAAELYESVLSQAAGLDRARLVKRIEEANDQKTGRREKRVALADLPVDRTTNTDFTTNGTFKGESFTCRGATWPKALMAFAHHQAGNSIFYTVPKGARRILGTAGVFTPHNLQAMGVPPQPGGPLTFEIYVDGKLAWKSPPLDKRDATADFDVDLYGATKLELRTTSKSATSAWCAWLNPEILLPRTP